MSASSSIEPLQRRRELVARRADCHRASARKPKDRSSRRSLTAWLDVVGPPVETSDERVGLASLRVRYVRKHTHDRATAAAARSKYWSTSSRGLTVIDATAHSANRVASGTLPKSVLRHEPRIVASDGDSDIPVVCSIDFSSIGTCWRRVDHLRQRCSRLCTPSSSTATSLGEATQPVRNWSYSSRASNSGPPRVPPNTTTARWRAGPGAREAWAEGVGRDCARRLPARWAQFFIGLHSANLTGPTHPSACCIGYT